MKRKRWIKSSEIGNRIGITEETALFVQYDGYDKAFFGNLVKMEISVNPTCHFLYTVIRYDSTKYGAKRRLRKTGSSDRRSNTLRYLSYEVRP